MSDKMLSDVLCTLAANWVTCECAMRIANHGLDGWQKKIPQVDAEIDRLNAQLEVVESDAKRDELTAQREAMKAKSQALFDDWKKADEETEAYRRLLCDAFSFCVQLCPGIDDDDYGDLLYKSLGNWPLSSEMRIRELMDIVDKLPRDKWKSQPWADPVKPKMKAARRVAPNHRAAFIAAPNVLDVLLRTSKQ